MKSKPANKFTISLTSQQLIYINHYLPQFFVLRTEKEEIKKDKSKAKINLELKRIKMKIQSKCSEEAISSPENPRTNFFTDQFSFHQGFKKRTVSLKRNMSFQRQKADSSKLKTKKYYRKRKNTIHQFTNITQQIGETKIEQNQSIFQKKCRLFLSSLCQLPSAWLFRQPVDAIAMGVPQYYMVISNPMDLGTITKKFNKRKYFSFHDVVKDIQLIISNSFLFNADNEQYIVYTKKFETQFINMLEEFNFSICSSQISQTCQLNVSEKQSEEIKQDDSSLSIKSQNSQLRQSVGDTNILFREMHQQSESVYSQFSQNEFYDPNFKVVHIKSLRRMLLQDFSPQYQKQIYKTVFPEKNISDYRGFIKLKKNEYAKVNHYLRQVQRKSEKNIRRYLELRKKEIYQTEKEGGAQQNVNE